MPDYKRETALCSQFMRYFLDGSGREKYMRQLTRILRRDKRLLEIELDDIVKHSVTNEELLHLADNIENNTKRYRSIFADAADQLMQDVGCFPPENFAEVPMDVFDIIRAQRQARMAAMEQRDEQDPQNKLPPELLRRYDVVFLPRNLQKPLKMREVSARNVGKLVTLQGIVTQVTDVKPLIEVATYIDNETGLEAYQVVAGKSYNPLIDPPAHVAQQSGSKKPMQFTTHGSKFVQFQEVKIQEMAIEVPQGNTPRSIVVHFRGGLTRSCKPGDTIKMSGMYLPEPFQGFRAMRAGLLSSTFLEAMHVQQLKQSYQQQADNHALQQRVADIAGEGGVYDRLASSLAPEIFGHEDVKKALLLLMVGGVSKQQDDGMKLRGDIHVCLMGDPGVAKSQLIKHIAHISPRAVYTTGKGSSGVGLTAAVHRDPITSEMTLEGGALVLADKGICCIDEFDKMDEMDRTNIHEVMEQQTVSIAKAGINTSLNTRTTLLVAANPAWGRYDTRRSPTENINLPAALLSRFDLMWLILDKDDPDQDRKLAKHVMTVHKEGRAPPQENGQRLLSPELLRAYIARAKTYDPHIPAELTGFVATVYADMRREEAASKMPHSYTTPRTLLAILRLSQALARLQFQTEVAQQDIDEALRLMRMSKTSLLDDENVGTVDDIPTTIYTMIKDNSIRTSKTTYLWAELTSMMPATITREQLRRAVEEYGDYNVFNLEYPRPDEPTVHIV